MSKQNQKQQKVEAKLNATNKVETIDKRVQVQKKEIRLLSANSTYEIRKHLLQCLQEQSPKEEQQNGNIEIQVKMNTPITKYVEQLSKSEGNISLVAKGRCIPKLVSTYEIFKRDAKVKDLIQIVQKDIKIKQNKLDNGWNDIQMEIDLEVQKKL